MKIFLIGNYSLLRTTSMHLYANLLKKIIKNKGHRVEILKPEVVLNKYNFKIKILKKYLGYVDNYIIFGFKLYNKIKKNDVVHICDQANSILFPFLKTKKLILTCHDLISVKLLSSKSLKKLSITGNIYQRLILHFIKKFKKIICVSESTKKDLIKITNIKKKNIQVIHNTLNQNFQPMRQEKRKKILNKKKINFKFFLHVGGNIWYKNKEALVYIFCEFLKFKKNKNYKLILAGEKISEELKLLIEKLKLKNSIINLVNPNNETICALYSDAEALIFPSITEGFGWPIIEAQACGCPVFTSKFKPMTEIGKDSVYYFNPNKKIESAKVIKSKLKFKNTIIKKGFKNLKRFKLSAISKQYLDFYKNLNV
ncbi:MAG: glycosyltransferase family 4 protein [Pelagibacterales bacterium]|nr:glycosyltransferase family 4 protein [Pelagibacterales bacterium]